MTRQNTKREIAKEPDNKILDNKIPEKGQASITLIREIPYVGYILIPHPLLLDMPGECGRLRLPIS